MSKTCSGCGFIAVDDATASRTFARDSDKRDGMRGVCRNCDAAARKARRGAASVSDGLRDVADRRDVTVSGATVPAHETIHVQDSRTANGLILVVPDLHAPKQDPAAFAALLALMREHRFAEVILLGDAAELVSCSSFGGPETMIPYVEEAKQARLAIQQIRDLHAGPMVLTEGNHDLRVAARIGSAVPQMGGVQVDEIGYAAMGITVIPEREQPIRRGRLLLIHGHQDLGKFAPKFFTAKFAEMYGAAGMSILVGHTHKTQVYSAPRHDGERDNTTTVYGLGTLEARPRWLKGASGWSHEVAVADPATGIVQVLRIVDGRLWFGGKAYGA